RLLAALRARRGELTRLRGGAPPRALERTPARGVRVERRRPELPRGAARGRARSAPPRAARAGALRRRVGEHHRVQLDRGRAARRRRDRRRGGPARRARPPARAHLRRRGRGAVSRLGARLLGAALLRAGTYEEVEADPSSIAQAALVVAAACAAVGVATLVGGRAAGIAGPRLALQVAVAALVPAVGWVVGSALAYMV